MATKSEITQILAILGATYPRFTLTTEVIAAYVMFLKDIPADALKAAALRCAASLDFFPSVHELRQAVADNWRKAQRIPSALEAWQEVNNARPEVSWVEEVDGKFYINKKTYEWSHPMVERVAKLLGWPKDFPGDVPGVDRAHFFKAYDATVGDALEETMRLPEVAAFIENNSVAKLEPGK